MPRSRDREWDKCAHCSGSGKCSDTCCSRERGETATCTVCGGRGGEWRYKDNGRRVDDSTDDD
jgi:hypothetical protein